MSVLLKLEPCDIKDVKNKKVRRDPVGRRTYRNVAGIIEEFIESGHDCCKVCFCDSGRMAHIEVTILRRSVQSCGCARNKIKVVLRGSEVYLVRKDKWEALK